MEALVGFVLERARSTVSKKVAAGVAAVALTAPVDPVAASWMALVAMGIQAFTDISKYYIDVKHDMEEQG